MNKLVSDEHEYKIKYHSDLDMTTNERVRRLEITKEQIQTELIYLKGNLRCDEIIRLKVGAQVMCIVNIKLDNDDILCNGAQGIITNINEQGNPVVRYTNGYEMEMINHVWQSETIPGI